MVSSLAVSFTHSRFYPRFSAFSPAMVVDEQGAANHCLVEQLSKGGARLTGPLNLTVGEPVWLLLQLPGRAPFSVGGHIVRHHGDARRPAGADVFAMRFDARGVNHRSGADTAHNGPLSGLQQVVAHIARSAGQQRRQVLVVEESPTACATLVQQLMHIGHPAVAVTTVLDAIEWLLDSSSHFNTALVDTTCSRTDGCDLLTFLADEYPNMRRVALGRWPPQGSRHTPHAHAVLKKPPSTESLASLFARPKR